MAFIIIIMIGYFAALYCTCKFVWFAIQLDSPCWCKRDVVVHILHNGTTHFIICTFFLSMTLTVSTLFVLFNCPQCAIPSIAVFWCQGARLLLCAIGNRQTNCSHPNCANIDSQHNSIFFLPPPPYPLNMTLLVLCVTGVGRKLVVTEMHGKCPQCTK